MVPVDPITVLIGASATLFGVYTLFLRFSDPSKLGKLKPMQEQFGARLGSAIHILAYSVVPLGFGVLAIVLGVQGRSLL